MVVSDLPFVVFINVNVCVSGLDLVSGVYSEVTETLVISETIN
jgi:hypothetical protein